MATLEERKHILTQEIAKYSKKGWHVVSQTDTTAQLLKPKRFSFLWAVLWTFVFGVGLLIYLFYHWAKKEQTLYLTVDENGHLHRK